jgi:hypothetical protein
VTFDADDEAHALFEEARRRARRRRRRSALGVAAVLLGAVAAVLARGSSESDRAPATREPAPAPAPTAPTRLFAQLLTSTEPVVMVDPATGAVRDLKLPTSGGDWLERLYVTGGRLVWAVGDTTKSIGARGHGRARDLGRGAYLPSATPGRVWILGERRSLTEITVRGHVTFRGTIPDTCGGALVATARGALLCQARHADALVAVEPRTGRVVRRVRGTFPLATHGSVVASCTSVCHALGLTDVESGRQISIAPPSRYRFPGGYDGAFSPDGAWIAVAVKATGGPARVALIDIRAGRARVLPRSRLAADYRKFAWSASGELFFPSPGGRLMAYTPGGRAARLLSVRLGARILDLAAR